MDFLIQKLIENPETASAFVQSIIYSICFILLIRGIFIIIKSFIYLKKISLNKNKKEFDKPIDKKDPLTIYTAKIFISAYKESLSSKRPYPRSFIEDAARQIASNNFETNYITSITNIANLFPPLGFIGTVFGMILIFFSKQNTEAAINTIGLGAALFTTFGAIICFVFIEGFRILIERIAAKRIEAGLDINFYNDKV